MHVSAASTAVHTGMMGCRGGDQVREREIRGRDISDRLYYTYLKGTGNIRTR